MEKIYTKSELVQMIEDLKAEERADCEIFCNQHIGAENEERRHNSTVIIATLNTVLLELDTLNPDG